MTGDSREGQDRGGVVTLVRGSTDRLKLNWEHDTATGLDGTRYFITSEQARSEDRLYFACIRRPGVVYRLGDDFGEHAHAENHYANGDLTKRNQKKVCEWDAWDRAGRPAS